MWCHVLLGMPLLGLGLFLVLPLPVALPLYLLVVAVSLILYRKIMQSMKAPVSTGKEALLGQIVTTDSRGVVHWQGELWRTEPVLPAQPVRIVGLRGLQLMVESARKD